MPFTPYHFGPGLLLKAAAPRHFSFLAFSTTQVAIDLESLQYLTMGDPHVHRTMHTLPVATVAGLPDHPIEDVKIHGGEPGPD